MRYIIYINISYHIMSCYIISYHIMCKVIQYQNPSARHPAAHYIRHTDSEILHPSLPGQGAQWNDWAGVEDLGWILYSSHKNHSLVPLLQIMYIKLLGPHPPIVGQRPVYSSTGCCQRVGTTADSSHSPYHILICPAHVRCWIVNKLAARHG